MAVNYSVTAINARLNGVVSVIDGGGGPGQLRVFAGALLLAAVPLGTPSGTVSGGVLTFTVPETTVAVGTGTADNAIITNAGGVVMISGLGMTFAPLNVAAFLYIPRNLRAAAVGLFALLRNEGGSVGTSVGQTITERREIFHALRINENLDPLNPAVNSFFSQADAAFLQQTGDQAAAHQMALQSLENLREQQASALSYLDAFLIFSAVALGLAFLVPLMKRSAAQKGQHVAAE